MENKSKNTIKRLTSRVVSMSEVVPWLRVVLATTTIIVTKGSLSN